MKDLLKRTFESEFNESHYKEVILNLFNRFDFSKGHTLKHQFTEAEKRALNDFTYLGTYEDSQNKKLDVLIAELKGGTKVERARSLQRNLIGKYLKSNLKDSALVAFYSKDNPDWRLSFVKVDYRLDEKGVKTEIGTPSKRYSFLVGKTEPSHTAQKQLLPLLDDKKIPAIDEIEKLFSIEKVTKEFYTEIAKKFTELVGGERKIGSKKMVEKGCLRLPSTDDDTIEKEFAVRLIGRLLFCWFLKKKKSEKGVPLLDNIIISSRAVQQVTGYYHNMLERLFFQVLNTPHNKRIKEASHDPWPKVPFLNGGLFEPHRHDYYEIDALNHSKHLNTLIVSDEWLKELFEIFELFNFTIDESTTIDVDISVDPEMLGRIFENLLAEINPQTGETARKSTGSYYTPRPIVEYMVDESLKQYLLTQVSAGKDVIPVKTGIQKEKGLDSCLRRNDDNGMETKISRLLSYAESDIDLSEEEKDLIIDALDRVKIIDPACGSGAFPMGILHKMLLILQKIDPESKKWLTRKLARIDNKLLRKELEAKLKSENWDYVHKLGIIQNSIYGVDIQSIAVEISKLRFFLSLVVDEKIDDKKPNRGIVPLPNLEFKFVAANSLLGLPKAEGGLAESPKDIEKLRELRDAYFTAYGDEKRKIEKEFKETQNRMFMHALNWQATGSQTYKLSEWNPFADEASSWFDPEWMFGITSNSPLEKGDTGGCGCFDVVIANPPYVSHDKIKEKAEIKSRYLSYEPFADIYCYFIERAINLQNEQGLLCYITSNSYLRAAYGKFLRKLLKEKNYLLNIINIEDSQVFDSAIVNVAILISASRAHLKRPNCHVVNSPYNGHISFEQFVQKEGFNYSQDVFSDKPWSLSTPELFLIQKKIESNNKTLEQLGTKIRLGLATGHNEAFIIGEAKKRELCRLQASNEEIIKPILRGRDIARFNYTLPALHILLAKNGINVKKDYPHIYKHLESYGESFKKRGARGQHWTNLRACSFFDDFKEEKIIWIELADVGRFALCREEVYLLNSAYFLLPPKGIDAKYLLGLLNSTVIRFYLGLIAETSGMGTSRWINNFVKEFPIPLPSSEHRAVVITLVDQILTAKKKDPNADISALEKQIDEMVYALYGLTDEEIEIVEGKK